MSRCNGFCPPTIVMMIMSGISMALSVIHPEAKQMSERIIAFGVTAFSAVFWTSVTYMLCTYCHEGWAWFVLLFPIIVTFVFMLSLISLVIAYARQKGGATTEKMANYPFNNVQYQPPQSGDPVSVNSVCGYGANPSTYLRPQGASPTVSDLPGPVTPNSQPAPY